MTDQDRDAYYILKDILSRYDYLANDDVIWERSKIRVPGQSYSGDRRRPRPGPYNAGHTRHAGYHGNSNHYLRNGPVRSKEVFYGDVSSVRRKPAAYVPAKRPQSSKRPQYRPAPVRQPINEPNYVDEPEIHIESHVRLPPAYKPTTQYEAHTSSYQNDGYETNTESEEQETYDEHQEADYAENLQNHQMDSKPYDEANADLKKYRLKVNLILHNYRHRRGHDEIGSSSNGTTSIIV